MGAIDLMNLLIQKDLSQIVSFITRIPECDSQSPALLNFFLLFYLGIYSAVTFTLLGNYDHVTLPCFIYFPSYSKRDAPFHFLILVILNEMFHGRISLIWVLLLMLPNFMTLSTLNLYLNSSSFVSVQA